MNELDLFDELTFIDDDLILEAHESHLRKPIRFRGLRKAAVIAAAVMALMITAGAKDWSFQAAKIAETYGNEENRGHIWIEDGTWYRVDNTYCYLNDQEIPYTLSEVYTPQRLQYYAFCEGNSLRVVLEAMVLYEDGHLEYKQITVTQQEQISLQMDNFVDGKAGTIIHVRRSLQIKDKDGWLEIDGGYCYLPTQIGFEIPYGIDARFPDMQYNYDGRG